ncbi:MAG TPA: DNA mismatch repair endonuclease MutL [Gemmatimonadales bacterium]|jgi:DNA mismatch repair protein MutL|nr:DNA mismatch repair endonuclease MutL [Gemmatimonadales bacterium]
MPAPTPQALRRVAILADTVANQIAAGEVVERPASVVKELVENALDGGAHHVRIELEQGGKNLIAVSDDGSGMGREDAVLALERHATSKIASAADLVGVRTFGFRGEALPAIASVSRFTLQTSDGAEASELTVSGGRLEAVAEAARQRGTTVTVRGLFYNTPARRKFLRSTGSETRGAAEAVATLALAHPAAGFELVVDGSTRLLVPPGQDEPARLAGVWGPQLAGTLIAVSYASGPVRVMGFAQRPGDAAPTGRRAQLFVNGRPFRDPFLIRAAEAGYRSAIHPGDRPSLLLRLELDPAQVDVNVHPAKLEVRFRDRMTIERVVEEAIRHALSGLEAAAPLGEWRPLPRATESAGPGGAPEPDSLFAPLDSPLEEFAAQTADGASPASFGAPVVQLFSSYIAFEGHEGLVIVDQHSAHERVLYEEVMDLLATGHGGSQRLLLPETLELTDEELDALERHREAIEAVGYQVEPFGGRSVVLQAVPAPHPRFDALACFRELVADLARGRFGGWANRLERFAATYACRAAVKAGMPLTETEMRALLLRLFETRLPPHDVHGRSTIVQLPREELERRFGRR